MKVICLIVDAMGIGPMEDVPTQGCLANTVVHVCERERELHLPNFEALGLGNLINTPCIKAVGKAAIASYGRMNLGYAGADTYLGHQNLMGTDNLVVEKHTIRELAATITEHLERLGHKCKQFPGFDGPVLVDDCIVVHDCMEAAPGLSINVTASLLDTDVEHVIRVAEQVRQVVSVSRVIVVTSHVFSFSDMERSMVDPHNGAVGIDESVLCTLNGDVVLRHFGLPIDLNGQCPTRVAKLGIPVFLVGKAADVLQCHEPSCTSLPMVDTTQILNKVEEIAASHDDFLIVVNIQETDLSGHAQNGARWADLLELIDARLPRLLELVGDQGAFLLSGDHGNDPYIGGNQHTREMTPCFFYSKQYQTKNLGLRNTLADIGATISDLFGAGKTAGGTSLLTELVRINMN